MYATGIKKTTRRADHQGTQRVVFERNRKKIIMTQEVCAICGRPVDKTLKSPDPMSATVDHIIPISKGGHPSDIGNLQLTHRSCNRWKSDKVMLPNTTQAIKDSTRRIYQSKDWKNF